MARTREGKKIVPVKEHKRRKPGGRRRTVSVRQHRRSTPNRKKK